MSPLSNDPAKREIQLGNLQRGKHGAAAGNQRALTHGANSPGRVRERRMRLLDEQQRSFPNADPSELLVLTTRMARLELLGEYLDERGPLRNRKTGEIRAAAALEERLAGALERQIAGLLERERTSGGKPTTSLADIVAELTDTSGPGSGSDDEKAS